MPHRQEFSSQWSFLKFCLWYLSFFFLSSTAFAQSQARLQGIAISANELFRDSTQGLVQLDGDVQVVFQNQHLSCDHATVHLNTKEVEATGDVVFITPTATVHGERVVMNYEKNIGTIYNGYVISGQVIFEGDIIHKTGEKDYITVDGKYTACATCPPGWSFSGSQIKATLGGYAYINNTLLKFGRVPVLWLPYLMVPLKSTRQTGLLTPELEISSISGLTVSQPFFWAMGRSQDSTWTLKNYEFRGAKGLLNYRYRLSENSGGEFNGGILNDRVFKSDKRLNAYRPESEQGQEFTRWFYRYQHYYDLPDGFVQRTSLNMASDLQYPYDFERETLNRGQPAMENRVSLTQNKDFFHWSIDTSYYYNLLQSNPLAANRDAVHRFPEIHMATTEQHLGDTDFLYNVDINYTQFARSGFAYDDIASTGEQRYVNNNSLCNPATDGPNCPGKCQPGDINCNIFFDNLPGRGVVRDGRFDDTDLIRAGQRLDFTPSISRPMSLGPYLEVMPRLSYRETQYQFPIDKIYSIDPANPSAGPQSHSLPGVTRRYLRGEISLRTTGSSVFGDLNDITATRYKHEIQPELVYTNIPWLDLPEHPFFGKQNSSEVPFFRRENVSDADLDGPAPYGLQFDYNDRIFNRNLVTLILNNKIIRKEWIAGNPTYKQILLFRTSQSYDAQLASRGSSRPWSPTEFLFDLRLNRITSLVKVKYYRYQDLSMVNEASVAINSDNGSFLGLSYVMVYQFKDEGLDPNTRKEKIGPSFGFSGKYLGWMSAFGYDPHPEILNPGLSDQRSSSFQGWTNLLQIKPPGNCWSIYISHEQKFSIEQEPDSALRHDKIENIYGINFEFLFDGVRSTSVSPNILKKYGVAGGG